MRGNKQQYQRGVSLSGLIVVLVVLSALALLAAKVLPAWSEYRSANDAMAKAKAGGGSVAEMRSSFDKNAQINNVNAVAGRDLVFSNESGENEISFAYEKRIPLAGNVSLVIDYAATTDKSGVAAAKTASAEQK
jgi:type II secretory pathway pseudopilin PulG